MMGGYDAGVGLQKGPTIRARMQYYHDGEV
jgi:hypothetical protein